VIDTVDDLQTTYDAIGLSAGGVYYSFRVAAVNTHGVSGYGAVYDVQTPNDEPTIAEGHDPSAAQSPVTGTSTTLSTLGEDDGGESHLTYFWSVVSAPGEGEPEYYAYFSGAGPMYADINGTNAAKNVTVEFIMAGDYTLGVTITDAAGASVTSDVSVTVDQTLNTIAVTPDVVVVLQSGSEEFAATAFDQFGDDMTTQPTFTWSFSSTSTVTSGPYGTISGGVFTARVPVRVPVTAYITRQPFQ
jgi:hypothetical protein